MKKFTTLFFATFILSCLSSFAQLSGTKIIGASPSDYPTFTDAVGALNTQGVNGNLVFSVKPGVYTERISINQVFGAGAGKTITFQSQTGDSTSVILQYASSSLGTNNYVVQLNGADYVTFKNMTIKRTDTLAYSVVVDIRSGARKNSFINNIIVGNTKASSSTYKSLVTSDINGRDCFNTFSNNSFFNGDFGIYFLGQGSTLLDSGTVVNNNKFVNQAYRAMYFMSQLWLSVKGNTITTNATNNQFYGIYAQYSMDSMRISKNKIALSMGFGVYLTNCNETGTQKGLISNNFISVGGTSNANGIYISNTKHQYVYYNSINIFSSHTTSGVALNISGSTIEDIQVRNNALANTGGGYAYFVTTTVPTTGIAASDYNDIFSSGVYVGSWKSTGNITNLANWKYASLLDAHSVSANPVYSSSTDLHAHNGALNGTATAAIAPVVIKDDIDGNLRSLTTPDIGADEFSIEDVGVSNIVLNTAGYCPGINFSIDLMIRNYSLYAFSGSIPLYYQIAGSPPVSVVTPVVNIGIGDSLLYSFTYFQSLAVPGFYTVKAGTNVATDINAQNDTNSRELLILSPPPASAGSNQNICLGNSITLTATGGAAYVWSVTPPNNTASISVTPLVPTTYIVTVVSVEGCTDTAQVTITPMSLPDPVAGFSYVPAGLQVSFNNTSTDATEWDWSFGDGGFSSQQNPVYNYPISGSYIVSLIASNLCASDTTEQLIGVVGMDENMAEAALRMGPNPAKDVIRVNGADLGDYEIFAANGQLLQSGTFANGSMDVSKLACGSYLIRLKDEKGRLFGGKFVKE